MEDPAIVQDEILGSEGAAEGNWMTMRALFVGDAQLAKQVLATQVRAEVPCKQLDDHLPLCCQECPAGIHFLLATQVLSSFAHCSTRHAQ